MGDRPPLSKGELDVARVLWDIGPAGVRQVHEVITQDRGMDFSTVQTYLRRLESKGYASSRLEGRMRVYSARAKPRTVIRQTVDELVDRLFGGDTMPLVKHLIEDGGISAEELGELLPLCELLQIRQKSGLFRHPVDLVRNQHDGGGNGLQPASDVLVLAEETVGPFDTQVVTSADPEATTT